MQEELNQLVYKEALTGGRSLSNTAKQQPGYCWVLKGTGYYRASGLVLPDQLSL